MNKRNPEEVLVGISSHLRLFFFENTNEYFNYHSFCKNVTFIKFNHKNAYNSIIDFFSNICNMASNSLPFYWLTIIFIYIYCGVLKIIQDQLVY